VSGEALQKPAAAAERPTRMRALVAERYGIDALELKEIETPALPDDRILVRVRAASLNKLDWYSLNGTPLAARVMTGLRRPKSRLTGHDFAGIVEAVGKGIHDFRPGDEVFGANTGAFAEVVRTMDGRVAPKPANLSFEEASAVPIAALTALQGLRDHGRVQPGQHVLVHGASGGVGTFAVQFAKVLGAEVTALCSARHVQQARALGADHVVDYTKEDLSRSGRRFDVIFHVGGHLSWSRCRRLLAPEGRLIMAGATGSSFLGPLGYFARTWLASLPSSRTAVFFIAKFNRPDLDVIRELLESGQVKPVVEKRYELGDVADALRYLGEGHARGKIVVTV
jgi:NADPH:quinone reductase-like Zn-dependent oxidoreductase